MQRKAAAFSLNSITRHLLTDHLTIVSRETPSVLPPFSHSFWMRPISDCFNTAKFPKAVEPYLCPQRRLPNSQLAFSNMGGRFRIHATLPSFTVEYGMEVSFNSLQHVYKKFLSSGVIYIYSCPHGIPREQMRNKIGCEHLVVCGAKSSLAAAACCILSLISNGSRSVYVS
jgi:hypothetical protein